VQVRCRAAVTASSLTVLCTLGTVNAMRVQSTLQVHAALQVTPDETARGPFPRDTAGEADRVFIITVSIRLTVARDRTRTQWRPRRPNGKLLGGWL